MKSKYSNCDIVGGLAYMAPLTSDITFQATHPCISPWGWGFWNRRRESRAFYIQHILGPSLSLLTLTLFILFCLYKWRTSKSLRQALPERWRKAIESHTKPLQHLPSGTSDWYQFHYVPIDWSSIDLSLWSSTDLSLLVPVETNGHWSVCVTLFSFGYCFICGIFTGAIFSNVNVKDICSSADKHCCWSNWPFSTFVVHTSASNWC